MTKASFVSMIFIILFWCSAGSALLAGILDIVHLSNSALLFYRITGVGLIVDALIMWCCK